ncbi:MAG: bifunctional phosphopantothenoylcysteine decarboxylase/phosphopantothenate--cysteine ligase CoaBC [Turicibacter sp.]|nr:bifunctional phosphopantothenoylcysteine decarboxylase/phosphopantothenate--cysteine ligase CoaBC [Turicibacter sp.]
MKKTIVIGVTGGIAAFKSAQLCSNLMKKGYDVHVIMTKNATEFISPLTFETLTHNRVSIETFDRTFKYDVNHISLAQTADLFVVAPATANFIAKAAHGLADDMLSTTFLAARCPKLIAPAMNTGMLENPVTRRNFSMLVEMGIEFVDAASGLLACGDVGAGKLADVADIEERMEEMLVTHKPLKGKMVVVTAGPTREPMDPVRFISNHSTGKMGYAMARAAKHLGASVKLISGPTHLTPPAGVQVIPVGSASQMFEAMKAFQDQYDILVKTAAVSDFRPKQVAGHKIKKNGQSEKTVAFVENQDILAYMGDSKKPGQIICGFAMETENLIENATQKLHQKGADLMVANSLNEAGAGFGGETNKVTLVGKDEAASLELMGKDAVAMVIMEKLAQMLGEKQNG